MVCKRVGHSPIVFHFAVALSLSSISVAAPPEDSNSWVGTWTAGPHAEENKRGASLQDTTIREIVHVSAGGSAIRVVLSNEFGTSDLRIGGVTVANSSAKTGTKHHDRPFERRQPRNRPRSVEPCDSDGDHCPSPFRQFDGVVDFAKATADPADPRRFSTVAGRRDHLHPNDAGYALMGESIDLRLFVK